MGYLQELLASGKDELVNMLYNRQVADVADYSPGETDPHGHGKRIPYIGWFWRHTDFVGKQIAIGDCGFIGVMENNKWDYPERMMSEQEATTFIDYLERAFHAGSRGGIVSETKAARDAILAELWDWFQTLTISETEE